MNFKFVASCQQKMLFIECSMTNEFLISLFFIIIIIIIYTLILGNFTSIVTSAQPKASCTIIQNML